jgi:hypothetical protein
MKCPPVVETMPLANRPSSKKPASQRQTCDEKRVKMKRSRKMAVEQLMNCP